MKDSGSPVLRVLAFVLAVALGLGADWWLFSRQAQDFAAAGLGINTTSNEASFYDGSRRVICFSVEDLERCLGQLPPSTTRKRLLWLGWSQLYAINAFHAGERTAPALLAERLDGVNVDLIAIAMPNINPREELLVYEYLRPRLKLAGVIVPAWLQGMKQEGIRPTWQAALADPAVRSALAALPSGAAILGSVAPQAKSAQEIGQHGLATDTRTTQERVEQRLVAELTDRFAPWRVRSEAQGEIKLALLAAKEQVLRLRNLVLGTRAANWVNVIPPARYAINLEALTDLVSAARRDGLPVLVYVPPRPSGRRFPFDPAVYAAFKSDAERIARTSGAAFASIEDTVADDVWGEADNGAGEIVTDHSHFTAAGHRQMSDALARALRSTILPQMQ
jgi:glycerophosphoryl diester phosphodiesterase